MVEIWTQAEAPASASRENPEDVGPVPRSARRFPLFVGRFKEFPGGGQQ